jgi:hypothetical protein
MADMINNPPHYTNHPSGVECIAIAEHMNFCLGNALKYLWRAGEKGDALEDLKKARWYLDREIVRLGGSLEPTQSEDVAPIGSLRSVKAVRRMALAIETALPFSTATLTGWLEITPGRKKLILAAAEAACLAIGALEDERKTKSQKRGAAS